MKTMGVFLFIVTAFFLMSFCRAFEIWIKPENNDGNCTANNNCTDLEKCEKNKCIDACESFVCGKNAWCDVQGHSPVCACQHRYNGDPNTECVEQECTQSGDCDEFDECTNHKCIDACESMSCGENAWCDVRNHVAFCICMDRHHGDPITGCIRENCTTSTNCSEFETCKNHSCIDACESMFCGENAWCDVKNHVAFCICMDRHHGDPNAGCIRENCNTSTNCFEFETCKDHNCIDACEAVSCGMNTQCNVTNHEALCICPMGKAGNPHAKCLGMSCTTNDDCDESQECGNKKCIPTSTPLKSR